MSEDIFTVNVGKIEQLYSVLIKGETTPQQEAELRVELIDVLSNIEASIVAEKEYNKEFVTLLESVREALLNWDPYGQWFRYQKKLVDLVYSVIVNAKTVVFSQEQESSSEAKRLKKELDIMKSEINDLRSLLSSLVKKPGDSHVDERAPMIEASVTEQPQQETEPPVSNEVQAPIEEFSSEPPLLLPIEPDEVSEPVISPSVEETLVEEPTEPELIAPETLKKLAESKQPESEPSIVLSQMKEIIAEAEHETERQMMDFKEQMESKTVTAPIVEEISEETTNTSELVPSQADLREVQQPIIEEPLAPSEDTGDTWVKPSEVLKEKETVESTTPAADPYMQLLTLEAEKYRLEKGIEKNETDFQEGLKSKQEFDETIQQINKELSLVREHIDNLRKQLTS